MGNGGRDIREGKKRDYSKVERVIDLTAARGLYVCLRDRLSVIGFGRKSKGLVLRGENSY